jgi:hypothetical protein
MSLAGARLFAFISVHSRFLKIPMHRLILVVVILLAAVAEAAPVKLLKARDQCMDGVHSRFIAAAPLSLKEMVEQLPDTDADDDLEKPVAPTKLVWKPLPEEAKVTSETIAVYRGREIYRIVYEWTEPSEEHRRAILMAAADPLEDSPWRARPFFIANFEEVTSHEAKVVSTAAHPFTVNVEILWRGSGHDWAEFEYLFDERGPYLHQKQAGARRTQGKTTEYRGNKVFRTTVIKEE